MLPLIRSGSAEENTAKLAALDKVQAVIEFAPDGTILTANRNLLDAVGYALEEIRGRHHGMFVEPAHRESQEYRRFWAKLGEGEFQAGQFKRFGKGGKEVWIEASYNPIRDLNGRPFKVVKFATDITARKLADADVQSQMAAIGKSQSVIQFALDGTILTANRKFLDALGYSLRSAIPSTRSRAGTTASSWTRKPRGAPSTKRSGGGCARASSTRGSTAASARTRRPSGSRRPTTRCSTRTASWSRSSNSPAT
jgi:methyl-accepting chemotaxis protein